MTSDSNVEKNNAALQDAEFLKQLDNYPYKQEWVIIEVLNAAETPVVLTGYATGGSISENGSSSLRRTATCSLIVSSEGINNASYSNILAIENLLSINKIITLKKKIKNTINNSYPAEIIFPLGVFVIKTASVSQNTNGFNISLTLHDKAARLNGTCGGVIPAGVIFSEIENISPDGSSRSVTYPTIKEIITSLLIEFGGESTANIIISDLPEYGQKLLKWTGNNSVYLNIETPGSKLLSTTINSGDIYNTGDLIGYQATPLIYPGKLECKAGDTVASVLDKIKNVLGNFEWFYDVQGKFHFQKKQDYLLTYNNQQTIFPSNPRNYTAASYLTTANVHESVYSFNDTSLITSISVNPVYDNIKNDITIWGTSKTATGVDKPIRYHLIVDNSPLSNLTLGPTIAYKDYRGLWALATDNQIVKKVSTSSLDDPHKIYYEINGGNSLTAIYRYDAKRKCFRTYDMNNYKYFEELTTNEDWRVQLYFEAVKAQADGTLSTKPYYAELLSEFPKYWDVITQTYTGSSDSYEYWLDIITPTDSYFQQFLVSTIGRRSKVVTDNSVTNLFPANPPAAYLLEADGEVTEERNIISDSDSDLLANLIQVAPEVWKNISISSSRNSAFDEMRALLQQHLNYTESVTLSTIPIYHLEPNTLIELNGEDPYFQKVGLRGKYLIKNISIPLDTNGTQTISLSKLMEYPLVSDETQNETI